MKASFCWNSRRWVLFMYGSNTKTCKGPPIGANCDNCGYYEEREMTEYFKKRYHFFTQGELNELT